MQAKSYLISILLLLTTSMSFSKALDFDPCSLGCSPQQKAIYDTYKNAQALSYPTQAQLYLGACYHTSTDGKNTYFDGTEAHYALMLLEPSVEGSSSVLTRKAYANGQFGQFVKLETYEAYDVEKFKKVYPPTYDDNHAIRLDSESGFVNYHATEFGSNKIRQSFFKQDPESGELLIIARWSTQYHVFCSLLPHH